MNASWNGELVETNKMRWTTQLCKNIFGGRMAGKRRMENVYWSNNVDQKKLFKVRKKGERMKKNEIANI